MLGLVSSCRLLPWSSAALLAAILQCAGLQTAEIRIPQNGDFATWEPAVAAEGWTFAGNECPLDWIPVVRAGVTGSLQRVDGGEKQALALNGRILSKQVYPGYRGKVMRVSVRARGAGGRLAVYLRECDSAESRQVKFVAIALDTATTAEWKDYSGVVEMTPYHNDDAIQIDLDGSNVQLSKVRLETTGAPAASAVKAPEVICALPLAKKLPLIDGTFSPEEWRGGVCFTNGFMDILSGQAVAEQTECHLASDGTTLFLALLAPIPRNGLRSVATHHDEDVGADDCIELYLNPGYAAGKSDTVYQLAVNFAGATFDLAQKHSIGQMERAWTCEGLTIKSGQYQDRALLEIAIPGKSVDLPNLALGEWGLNVCRSLWAAKQKTSLTGGGYSDFARMMRCRVAEGAPAVQWGFSGTPHEGRLVLMAELTNPTVAALTARVAVSYTDGPEQREAKELMLAPGASGRARLDLTGQTNERGLLSCVVVGPDGKPWFRQSMSYVKTDFFSKPTPLNDSGKQITAEYFPFQHKFNLRISPVLENERKAHGKTEFLIKQANGSDQLVVLPALTFIENTAYATIPLDLPVGTYVVQASVFGQDGKILQRKESPIEVKQMPWVGNDIGKEHVIVPPFTAMQYAKNEISCWGRAHAFAPTGLPEQITALGKPLLAGPVALVLEDAQGVRQAPVPELKWGKRDADRCEFTARLDYPGLRAELAAWMEYDGCLFYKMDLTPQAGGTAMKSFALEIPLRDPSLLHAVGDSIRVNCVSSHLDEQDGLIWSSKKIRNTVVVGDFLSSIWIGRPEAGLSWFAENERGWSVGLDKTHLEVIRVGKVVTLRVNFLAGPMTLTSRRHIEFGLMATPTKPRKTGASIRPDVQAQGSFAGFFNAGLKSLDPEISRLLLKPQLARTEALHIYHAGDSCLIGDPDFKYILDEVRREPFDRNLWEMESKKYKLKGDDSDRYISESVCWTPERVDYNMDCVKRLQEDLKIPGVYLDNSYPLFCRNVQHKNCGFIRDDGRLQAGCNILGTRDFIKRCAAISYLNKMRDPHFSVHNTDAMVIAAFAFADIAVAGEMNIPDNGDHMDVFSLAHCEVLLGTHWGPTPGMLTMLGNGPRALSAKGTRSMLGLFKLYDIWNYWNSARNEAVVSRLTTIEGEFGTSAADAVFIGYWDARASALGLAGGKNVRASYFMRPGGALVYVTNLGRQAKMVTLKPDLGVWQMNSIMPVDAETGKPCEMVDGVVTLTIEPRDFRVLQLKAVH